MPLVPAAGVPESVAVPLPLSTNVTPDGRVPVCVIDVTSGVADVVIAELRAAPTLNVVAAVLVDRGVAALGTVSTKFCVVGPTTFAAVIVKGYVPAVLTAAVPASVAVPLPLSVNVTPDGSAPTRVSVAVGMLVVEIVNVPGVPITNVVEAALV